MRRIPGGHSPNVKNRSSKHLILLTKQRSVYRSMSNAALAEVKDPEARREEQRRAKRREKKAAKQNVEAV